MFECFMTTVLCYCTFCFASHFMIYVCSGQALCQREDMEERITTLERRYTSLFKKPILSFHEGSYFTLFSNKYIFVHSAPLPQ